MNIHLKIAKGEAVTLLTKQKPGLTPAFSNTAPRVRVFCMSDATSAKLNSLPLGHLAAHEKAWELHPRPPSQAPTDSTSTTH